METTNINSGIEEDGFSLKPEGIDWWVIGIIVFLVIIYLCSCKKVDKSERDFIMWKYGYIMGINRAQNSCLDATYGKEYINPMTNYKKDSTEVMKIFKDENN